MPNTPTTLQIFIIYIMEEYKTLRSIVVDCCHAYLEPTNRIFYSPNQVKIMTVGQISGARKV